MNKISQIPTEHNVTHLFNIFSNAWCQRNADMAVSEREVRRKEDAYQKLYIEAMNVKYCEKRK